MMNDAERLSPAVQRNVADDSSGVLGGTVRGGKNLLGRAAEKAGYGINLFTEKLNLGENSPEARKLNEIFESEDLIDVRNKKDTKMSDGSYDGTISNFVKYFEGNGVTDGKEMMAILKDSIAENTWDSTTDDNARVLSDGTLRINPKFVANPDAQEGIKAIRAANVPPEVKEQEIAEFQQARKFAAAEFDKKAKSYDEDYREHAAKKAAEGVTDPEEVFFSWPGLDRNWIEGSWDVVRDTVASAGRGIANTGRSVGAGLSEKAGLDNIAAGFGRELLESKAKQGFVQDIAAARGQEGAITGTAKELGTTLGEMGPMFAGGALGRVVVGAGTNAARQILGKALTATSVYGYAGAQGYGSLMQTALMEAEAKARQEGRELTDAEINSTVEKFQGAALANGFQTAVLAKLLPEGAEKTAIQGLTAKAGTMTGRDVVTALRQKYGQDGLRAAVMATKPELVEFAKRAYKAGKVGFKDDALEEGVNQFLEGLITKTSGADADKTWDAIGQETWKGTWMGGVIGGGLPVAQQTLARQDPAELAARSLIAGAQEGSPVAAAAAMEDLEGSIPNELDDEQERLPPTETIEPPGPTEVQEAPAAEGSLPEGTPAPLEAEDPAAGEGRTVEIADQPSQELAPKSTETVAPRPARNGRDTTARDTWDETYGGSHNPDGTPRQPTVLDETVAKILAFHKNTPHGEQIAATGGDLGITLGSNVRKLLNAGWIWDPETGRMVNPANPEEKPITVVQAKHGTIEEPKTERPIAKPVESPEQAAARAFRASPITPPTDGQQEVLTERDGVSDADAILPPPVPSEDVQQVAAAVETNPNAYSKENLATTFNLTPEQAEATDTLVQAMGLDTSRILLKKGGMPGRGMLGQETQDRVAAALPAADKQAVAAELGAESWTPEVAQTFLARLSDWLVSGTPDPLEGTFRKLLDSDKNLFQKPTKSQGYKGSFERLAGSGKMLLRGLSNPDVTTGIHELSHVARRTLFDRGNPVAGITPEDIRVAEDWAGAKNGKWNRKAEEKFARGFERYLRDGEAPTPRLAEVFGKIADWFRNIYQTLSGSAIDVQISPEMRKVFDTLVTRGTLPVKPASRSTEDSFASMSAEDQADFNELGDLTLKKGQAQNGVRGVKFSKKEEARFEILARKFRDVLFRQVNPSTDTAVGANSSGEPLFEDETGSRYRWRNDSPRTKPGGYADFGGDLAPVDAAEESEAPETPEPAEKPITPPAPPTPKPEPKPKAAGKPDTTSIKNAATDAELARMGFEPIAAPARKALGTSWDEAQAVVEADGDAGAKLVADILEKPRALKDDVENGVLLIELAKKKAAFGKAQKDYLAAVESGNKVEIDRTKSVLDAARGEVAQVIDAAKLTGTAWGRSGRFRQLAIDEDYSLVALENKYRTEVNDGKPLTERQIKEVQAMHDRIVAVEKKLEEAEAKIAKKAFEEEQAARKKAKPKIRKNLAPKLDAARKRLQEQGFLPQDAPPAAEGDFLAQEALPEQTLEDLGTIGASWLVEKDLDLRVFTNRIKRMFGDKAAPHAEAIYAKAKDIMGTATDAVVAETTDETVPRKKKTKEEILEGIDPDKDITGKDVFQLARAHVNAGVEGFENVMKAVLADLQSTHPDLTMREVHDAYSGYGKIIRPNPAEDLKTLREYRQLARLTSQLEDAEKKLAPMRTGLQRDKATEKVRVLQKKVKEAMRKMGIKAAGSKDLSTALDAIKNRLKNEFEELDAAVKSKTPLPGKTPTTFDAEAKKEIEELKAKRDAKKAEYDALFPKAGETVDEAIEKAEKSLDKSISGEEELIRKSLGKRPVQAKDRVAWSQGIADRRARLKELVKQRNDLRDKNAERLARNKKLVQSRTEKILKRLAEKNYEPKAKPEALTPDKELEALQLEEFRAKRAINEKIVEARRANRTRLERYRDNALDIAMVLGRAVNTALDLGHFGRQGGLVNFARPEITMRHLKDLVTFSETGADKAQMKLEGTTPEEKAMFKRAKDSGLGLTEWRPGHKLNDMEEAFKSHLAKKIPGIAASERAYVTYMNAIRFDYFNTLAKALPNPTKDNLKELANHVNNLTGRGSLDIKPLKINLENSASNLALLLFSPKYWSSRLRVAANILAVPTEVVARAVGLDFRRKEIRDARRIIAKEYGRMGIGGTAFYGLLGIAAAMAKGLADDDEEPFFKIGTDSNSSDFGKLVFRNGSRVDTMAGMSQNLTFLSRMFTGKVAQPDGDIIDLNDMEDSRNSKGQVAERFFRSKLAPLPSALTNLAFKRDTGYNRSYWEKELLGLYLPISVTETINGYNELGASGGTAGAISGFFGEGVNTYGEGVEDSDVRESILSGVHTLTGGKLGRSQEEYDEK
jgi:hypothetical protein